MMSKANKHYTIPIFHTPTQVLCVTQPVGPRKRVSAVIIHYTNLKAQQTTVRHVRTLPAQ